MTSSTDIAKFRRRIGDKIKSESDVITVDQSDTQFNLRFTNVFSETVYVNGAVQENDGDGTIYQLDSASGTITFIDALAVGDELRVDYSYAAYTDDEIEDYIDDYGFDAGVVEVLTELLTDSARMYDYSEGATSSKLSQIFDHLKELLEFYTAKAATDQEGYVAPDGTNYGGVTIGRRSSTYDPHRRPDHDDKEDLSRLIV